jgi:hypothetical protein
MLGFGVFWGSRTGLGKYLLRLDVSGERVGVVSLVVCHGVAEGNRSS